VDLKTIRLPQPDDQNAKVRDSPKFREATIRRNKNAAIGSRRRPKVWVLQFLI
jgi:hypothetical protein